MVAHILWSSNSTSPVICTRINWKSCPEHKYLSDKIVDRKEAVASLSEKEDSSIFTLKEYIEQK